MGLVRLKKDENALSFHSDNIYKSLKSQKLFILHDRKTKFK